MMENNLETTQGVSIRGFLSYVLKHWLIPAGILLLAPFCGLGYSLSQTPLYNTQAELTVIGSTAQTAGIARNALYGNYVSLAKSPLVLNRAAEELEQDPNASAIAEGLTVKNKSGAEVISFEYSTPQMGRAAVVVEKVLDAFKVALKDVYDINPESVMIFTYPVDSNDPYNVNVINNVLVAFGGGVVLAVAITFARFDSYRYKSGKPHAEPKQTKSKYLMEEELHGRETAVRQMEIEARELEVKVRIAEAKVQLMAANDKGALREE